MEGGKCFALGDENLQVDSSVTLEKYDSIRCGNITVLFLLAIRFQTGRDV